MSNNGPCKRRRLGQNHWLHKIKWKCFGLSAAWGLRCSCFDRPEWVSRVPKGVLLEMKGKRIILMLGENPAEMSPTTWWLFDSRFGDFAFLESAIQMWGESIIILWLQIERIMIHDILRESWNHQRLSMAPTVCYYWHLPIQFANRTLVRQKMTSGEIQLLFPRF